MIEAYRSGGDPARTLTLLSVWLGHSDPADTYWYLQAAPEVAVVMLTQSAEDEDLFDSLRAGASGYLLKDSPAATLVDGIRAAHDGRATLAPSVASVLLTSVRAPTAGPLSPRELQVLQLVADGATAVLGGIYTRNSGLSYSKVPFLGDIPVLGWLFKQRSENDERTEVLVFITPKITNKASLRCE